MIKKVIIVLTILFGPLFAGAQNFYFEYENGTFQMFQDMINISGSRIALLRGHPQQNLLVVIDNSGSLINSVNLGSTGIFHIGNHNSDVFCISQDNPTNPDSVFTLLIDSTLNSLTPIIPNKQNWPRKSVSITSTELVKLDDNNITLLGRFTDSSFLEPTMLYGYLRFNSTFDTLTGAIHNFESEVDAIYKLYKLPSGYVSHSFLENEVRPWSSTIQVSKILQLDSQLNLVKRTNFYSNSSIPGYPRTLESSGLRNLLVNDHSVYGLTEFEAATSNALTITAQSFALHQFDHNLNLLRVQHQLSSPGRVAETRTFSTRNICFDNSKKYIYAIGSNCEPSQGFNNQDRTCATVVMKYDTALNLIWRQEFEVPKTYLHAEVVTPTLDGGVLVGGIRIDSTPNPNHQKLFVMKIDSMGNHSASIKSHTQRVTHKTFPNPATDHFIVQWDQGNYHELHLYNQQGQLLFVQKQGIENNLMKVDIASLPPGLYFYRLLSTHATKQHLQGKILKK